MSQLVDSLRGLAFLKISCSSVSTFLEAARSPKLTRFAAVSIHFFAGLILFDPGDHDLQARRLICVVFTVKGAAYASTRIAVILRQRCALSSDLTLQVRADAFQSIILPQRGWEKFSIWGCGRDGKRFFNLLSRENKQRVRAPPQRQRTASASSNTRALSGSYVCRCCRRQNSARRVQPRYHGLEANTRHTLFESAAARGSCRLRSLKNSTAK